MLTAWLAGIALAFGCGAALILLAVPAAVETWLSAKLEARGVTVEAVPVKRIGLTTGRIGPGGLNRDNQQIAWQDIEVTYGPATLLCGKLKDLHVSGPSLRIRVPRKPLRPERPPPAAIADKGSPRPAGPSVPSEEVPPARPPDSGQLPPSESPAEPPTPSPTLYDWIERIPFREFFAEKGDLQLLLEGEPLLVGEWNGSLFNDPDRLQGAFRLTGGWLEMHGSVRAAKTVPGFSQHTELQVDPQPALEAVRRLAAAREIPLELPEISFSGPFRAELLAEADPSGILGFSAEGTLEDAVVQVPGGNGQLNLEQAIIVGTHSPEKATLDAGLRVRSARLDGFRIDGFGLRAAWDSRSGFSIQSEVIPFASGDWRGRCAIRGEAGQIPPHPGRAARMELSFARLEGPYFSMEPASLLLEGSPARIEARLSAVGLNREGTLWFENAAAGWNRESGQLNLSLDWYDSVGTSMGTVSAEGQLAGNTLSEGTLSLDGPEDRKLLSATVAAGETGESLDAEGALPVAWVNALARWWGLLPARLTGPDPSLRADLSHRNGYVTGSINLVLDGLGLQLDSGPVIDGIRGDLGLELKGLPRTSGKQQLRIDSVTTGEVVLRDVTAEFALPTFRHLKVLALRAATAGGAVFIDPFSFDPLEPEFETTLRLEGLEAGTFLEWLGEERFAVEGTVSGSIRLKWADGTIHIGTGSLAMDAADGTGANRFLFSDKAFLREQFKRLPEMPEALRDPILKALLHEGILLRDLRLEMVPLAESRDVSLRLTVSGESVTDEIRVPIRKLIVNNVISERDLGRLLGMVGPVRFLDESDR